MLAWYENLVLLHFLNPYLLLWDYFCIFMPFLQDIQKTFIMDIPLYTTTHRHPMACNTTLIYLCDCSILPSIHFRLIYLSFHQIFTSMSFHKVKDCLWEDFKVWHCYCKTFIRKKSDECSWSPFFTLVHDKYHQVFWITDH